MDVVTNDIIWVDAVVTVRVVVDVDVIRWVDVTLVFITLVDVIVVVMVSV